MYKIFQSLMDKRGVTAYKVAKDTGITQATLSRWKTGVTEPSVDTLQIIADYFGVTLDYMRGRSRHPQVEVITAAQEVFKEQQQIDNLNNFASDGAQQKSPAAENNKPDYVYIGNLSDKDKTEIMMLIEFKKRK